jgi:hypothetical protein
LIQRARPGGADRCYPPPGPPLEDRVLRRPGRPHLGPSTAGGIKVIRKLARVRGYLGAYTTIFKGNERTLHLRTTYADAFAGTGRRARRRQTGIRVVQDGRRRVRVRGFALFYGVPPARPTGA